MEEERKKTEQKVEVEYIQVNFYCMILWGNIYFSWIFSEWILIIELKVQIFVLGGFFSFEITTSIQ